MSKEWCLSLGAPLVKVKGKIPIEKEWQKKIFETYALKDFEDFNIGIVCGTEFQKGKYLHVIDVDPRNSGFETLKILTEEYDFDPKETLTVETGSGGHHYYYYYHSPLTKAKLGAGVDFIGTKGFVVGPGSIHEVTRKPYVLIGGDIQFLPEKLAEKLTSKIFFEHKKDLKDKSEVTLGSRNDYLFRQGSALRARGFDEHELKIALHALNEAKCKPKLPSLEVDSIVKSICKRYEPSHEYFLPPKKQQKIDFEKIYHLSRGLVKDIADICLKYADRPYPHFAVASALHIIAGSAQGTYSIARPDNIMKAYSSLALQSWLLAPSAAGKEKYKTIVETYLGAVKERILFGRVGSSHGLRAHFFISNIGTLVIDEFQDEVKKLAKSKSGFETQIMTDIKELTSDRRYWAAVNLSKMRHPRIELPRLSIFALGTSEGFNACIDESLVGGGFLSRFLVWPVGEIQKRQIGGMFDEKAIPKHQLEMLRRLYNEGLTIDGQNQNDEEQSKIYSSYNSKSFEPIFHKAQNDPTDRLIGWTKEASDRFQEFSQGCEALYLERHKALQNSRFDYSAGSIIDRLPKKAVVIAGLHAIGSDRLIITIEDIEFAIITVEMLGHWQMEAVESSFGSSPFEVKMEKIQNNLITLLKTPHNRRQIFQKIKIPARLLDEALSNLIDYGVLGVVMGDSVLPADKNAISQRGVMFHIIDK